MIRYRVELEDLETRRVPHGSTAVRQASCVGQLLEVAGVGFQQYWYWSRDVPGALLILLVLGGATSRAVAVAVGAAVGAAAGVKIARQAAGTHVQRVWHRLSGLEHEATAQPLRGVLRSCIAKQQRHGAIGQLRRARVEVTQLIPQPARRCFPRVDGKGAIRDKCYVVAAVERRAEHVAGAVVDPSTATAGVTQAAAMYSGSSKVFEFVKLLLLRSEKYPSQHPNVHAVSRGAGGLVSQDLLES